MPVDELRLSEVWAGEAVLLRANRGFTEADAPFSLRWLISLVMQEKRSLREIGFASLALSIIDDLSAVHRHDGGGQGADASAATRRWR